LQLTGDFIAIIDYEGLKSTPPKETWGSGLSFKVVIDQSYQTGLEARRSTNAFTTNAIWQIYTPLKQLYYAESLPLFAEAGRMKLQRRGGVLYYFTAPPGSDEFRFGDSPSGRYE